MQLFKKYDQGFVAGSFDIIHPGYISLFKEAKKYCNKLLVGLHHNPTIERKIKLPVINSLNDRKVILKSIKYIDNIITYKSELDLYNILLNKNIHVRFLGNDYKGKKFTGSNLNIPIVWIDRSHNFSATKIKKKIHKSIDKFLKTKND